MMLLICLLLYFINLTNSECVLDNTSRHILYERNLREHIKCNYQHTQRNTTVRIRFTLKSFRFYEDDAVFSIYSWLFMIWDDPAIKWNPEDYDGIKTTNILPYYIWTPELNVDYQVESDIDLTDFYTTECLVNYSGRVTCILRVAHTVPCKSILSNWPYNVQSCHFNYSSNVKLTHGGSRGVSALGAEYGSEWDIVDYKFADPNAILDKITITFVVERTAVGFACMNVAPLVVIAVLNMAAMILDTNRITRVFILGFSLMCCYNLMLSLMSNVPMGGSGSPKVLVFLRTSMFLLALSVIVTLILKNIRQKRNAVPPYVSNFNEFFLKNGRYAFIWPKWKTEDIEDEDLKKILIEWSTFANVLNSLIIVSYSIFYGILFIFYMPRPLPTLEN